MIRFAQSHPKGKNLLYFYFGHHKCASVWIQSIVSAVCRQLKLKAYLAHSAPQFGFKANTYMKEHKLQWMSWVNANQKYIEDFDEIIGFHVIRDPRDIIVSGYFSHLHSHPTEEWPALSAHRTKLKQIPKDEGLCLEMDFVADVMEDMGTWDYTRPNVLEHKLEDLSRNPNELFLDIFAHLGLLKKEKRRPHQPKAISAEKLLKIVYTNRFSAHAKGRSAGEEDVTHHFRKGVLGDWVNHFQPRHREYFAERYNDVLIKLGYEQDSEWVKP